MSERVDRVLAGFWTWVGDYVIGTEENRFLAIHKTGTAQIGVRFNEDREAAAKEIVERCQPRS